MTAERHFIIADDHPLFREALCQALKGLDGACEITQVGDFEAAKQCVAAGGDFDLLLLDLTMPGTSGLSGVIAMRAIDPALPILVISAHDDGATVRRALELGAAGFISKSAPMDVIRRAVADVLEGGIAIPADIELGREGDRAVADLIARLRTLTPQQSRVLTMLGEGKLNKQIAYELDVSEATIKAHVSAVLHKLGVDSRTQAAIRLSRIASEPLAGVD